MHTFVEKTRVFFEKVLGFPTLARSLSCFEEAWVPSSKEHNLRSDSLKEIYDKKRLRRSKISFSKRTRSCGAEREKLRTYFERSRPKQGMLRTPKDVVLRRRGSSKSESEQLSRSESKTKKTLLKHVLFSLCMRKEYKCIKNGKDEV